MIANSGSRYRGELGTIAVGVLLAGLMGGSAADARCWNQRPILRTAPRYVVRLAPRYAPPILRPGPGRMGVILRPGPGYSGPILRPGPGYAGPILKPGPGYGAPVLRPGPSPDLLGQMMANTNDPATLRGLQQLEDTKQRGMQAYLRPDCAGSSGGCW